MQGESQLTGRRHVPPDCDESVAATNDGRRGSEFARGLARIFQGAEGATLAGELQRKFCGYGICPLQHERIVAVKNGLYVGTQGIDALMQEGIARWSRATEDMHDEVHAVGAHDFDEVCPTYARLQARARGRDDKARRCAEREVPCRRATFNRS